MDEEHLIYAYFYVKGFPAVDEITEIMGISPTKSWQEGDPGPYPFLHDNKRKSSCWKISSPLAKEIILDIHISALLEILEPRKNALKELHKKYEVGISCVGYYYNACPASINLSANLIQKCASLKLSLDFNLFCISIDDEDIAMMKKGHEPCRIH